MKTKDGFSYNRASLWAIGSLTALLALGMPTAFAQHGGGGGGHGGGGGGGGGHASMGGGHGGFGGGHAGGFGGGFAGGHPGGFGGHAMVGSSFAGGGAHYAPHVGYTGFNGHATAVNGYHGGYVGRPAYGGSGYAGRPGYGGGYAGRPGYGGGYGGRPGYYHGYGWGRGGWGWNRPYWRGGYWHGGWWPGAYYGYGYPWFLGVLPAVYATYWWDGIPYYYANSVYYTYNSGYGGYVVTDPPPVDTGDSSDNTAGGDSGYTSTEPGSTGSAEVYAYPKSGQSDEQQSTDRYECHKWAVAQSGFDPTHPSSGTGNTADYRRAMAACLDGRGYSTK